jgi:dTDP-4-amino-4,6-dideoxy-D-galactose acyltransferase
MIKSKSRMQKRGYSTEFMANTQLIEWDSAILEIPVAKILCARLQDVQLAKILQELRSQGIKLVYWPSDSKDPVSQEAAHACSGLLVYEKITYFLDLKTLPPLPFNANIEVYSDSSANLALQNLMLEIIPFSRFSHDPNIAFAKVKKLYIAWINNACKKIAAKVVLVEKIHGHIVGMVAIADKQGRSDLSLLAVSPLQQGKGIGESLVRAAQAWSLNHHYTISQVVTQKLNRKACRLYERCNYQLEKIECFYHFWL